MSLFGDDGDGNAGTFRDPARRPSVFDDDEPSLNSASMTPRSGSTALFSDDLDGPHSGTGPPWQLPASRHPATCDNLLKKLLASEDVPETYAWAFDAVVDREAGIVTAGGVATTLAAARLGADKQAGIMDIIGLLESGSGGIGLGRNEFHVLLALIGLAQEGDEMSLSEVHDRRGNLPRPRLPALFEDSSSSNQASFHDVSDLAAKALQRPAPPSRPQTHSSSFETGGSLRKPPSMEYPDDPWNTPDMRKNHNYVETTPERRGKTYSSHKGNGSNSATQRPDADSSMNGRTTSSCTTHVVGGSSKAASLLQPSASGSFMGGNGGGCGHDGLPSNSSGGFDDANNGLSELGASATARKTIGSDRTDAPIKDCIVVTLMPEKEGMFMFQHHNYEVASARRGSKAIRRYSDFVWLLSCLHKRYPFRMLPLLPPKRVAVNGNHLSNDGAFIEKRRRGLARFLNALVRHPVLGQEQLVTMFLTVPTELAIWRKQAAISVQDEFANRCLPAGLEDSLPRQLEDLFDQTRAGARRSAQLYVTICSLMDRLVKRSEGVAADHARIAVALSGVAEVSNDTYSTDTSLVPLLNDGLATMSKHLQTAQNLLEDEARAWDAGVLEDLKRQRDALVSLRDLFDRRDRLDRDNIPYLERRIQNNEAKLAALRAKPEGLVKPGELERVVEAIIADKASIVNQHNRSIFVKETLRDELMIFQCTQFHVSRWGQDWTQERVKYSEMLADNWRRLLDELERMPLGD